MMGLTGLVPSFWIACPSWIATERAKHLTRLSFGIAYVSPSPASAFLSRNFDSQP